MKLKNRDILTLVNAGLLKTTEHDVPAADAYKAYKFRRAVEKAFDALAEKDGELPKSAGVEDGQKPDAEQEKKISALREELYADEVELDGNIVPLSWEGYHALSNENKKVAVQMPTGETNEDGSMKFVTQFVDVFRSLEPLLEGVLFKAEE